MEKMGSEKEPIFLILVLQRRRTHVELAKPRAERRFLHFRKWRGLLRNTALSNAYIIFIIQKVFPIRKILFLIPCYKNETSFRLHYFFGLEPNKQTESLGIGVFAKQTPKGQSPFNGCLPSKPGEARAKNRGFASRSILRYVRRSETD